MNKNQSLQQKYAAQSICFGCGPANEKGLRINSFPDGDKVIAKWLPSKHHQAFVGTLNGGIIGALLDCHCNWAAAWHLMQKHSMDTIPCTVTAEYSIKLLKPTPSDKLITLEAEVIKSGNKSAVIAGKLMVDDEVFDTCEGVFVMVKEGHPAFHRW
jgi:acyl-coenzyme A thioesterase PaaI-like protein